MTERIISQDFLYPAFLTPSTMPSLTDQFAFRPTGSTTAALVYYILHKVTYLLRALIYTSLL